MNIDDITSTVGTDSVSEASVESQAQDTETNALEEFMADTEPSEDAQNGDDEVSDTEEHTESDTAEQTVPKGIKGRIMKAEANADKRGYERGKQEAYAEWEKQKAEYEAKIAEYDNWKLDKEAAETAKKYGVNKEFALRLLRAERGIAAPTPVPEKETPSKTEQSNVLSDERKSQLNRQAAQIKQKYNLDIMSKLTDTDAQAIFNGADLWEFAMREMANGTSPKASVPKPVRAGGSSSSNGSLDFSTMTDEEFDRFNAKIDRGAVYNPNKRKE